MPPTRRVGVDVNESRAGRDYYACLDTNEYPLGIPTLIVQKVDVTADLDRVRSAARTAS